jgi:hypothetical protein
LRNELLTHLHSLIADSDRFVRATKVAIR